MLRWKGDLLSLETKMGKNGRKLKVEDQNYYKEEQNQLYRTSPIPGTK